MSVGATLTREGFRKHSYHSDDVTWKGRKKFRREARRRSKAAWRREWEL